MHDRLLQFLLVTLLAPFVSLTGCKNQSSGQLPAPANAASGMTSAWKMALTFSPDPPVSDKDAQFHLKIADETGKSIVGAQVKAALVMATMDMGKNELVFTDQGQGNYQATGKFTMSGPWNVVATVTAQGKSRVQTFPVVVHEE